MKSIAILLSFFFLAGCANLDRPFKKRVPIQPVIIGSKPNSQRYYLQNSKEVWRSEINKGLAEEDPAYSKKIEDVKWPDAIAETSKFLSIFSSFTAILKTAERDRPAGNYSEPLSWLGGALLFNLIFLHFRDKGDRLREEVIKEYNQKVLKDGKSSEPNNNENAH